MHGAPACRGPWGLRGPRGPQGPLWVLRLYLLVFSQLPSLYLPPLHLRLQEDIYMHPYREPLEQQQQQQQLLLLLLLLPMLPTTGD